MNHVNEPHTVKARVWVWQGDSPWHFVTIEKEQAKEIKRDWHWPRKGFGSIPVKALLGSTNWKTSIFPEKGGTYVLPLKKEVRANEGIVVGQTVSIILEVMS